MNDTAHGSTEIATGTLASPEYMAPEHSSSRSDVAWVTVVGVLGIVAVLSVVVVAITGFESVRECVERVP